MWGIKRPQPDPTRPDAASNQYVFEKAVEFNNDDGSVSFGRVDLFRSGCFVLESKHAADVTRDIATRLAKLAKSLEGQHDPEVVAGFLMRCLFTMFAEDVELIRKDSFSELLLSLRFDIKHFQPMVKSLWESMDRGTFSTILREKVKQFNGKFFKDKTALPLTHDQLELLIEATASNWQYVEPSIFGTLLERALDPVERHKLGAHYTPRAYFSFKPEFRFGCHRSSSSWISIFGLLDRAARRAEGLA